MAVLTSTGIATAAGAATKGLTYAKGAKAFWERLQPGLRRKIIVKFEKRFIDFGEYLDVTYDRTTTVQLICSRAVKSHLNDVYVSCSFRKNNEKREVISDNDLISDIRDKQRTIVRGDGGSGKTLFMKRLWHTVYAEPMGKIPVFVDLRNLNELHNVDLITLVRHTISTKKELPEDLFVELAQDGLFLFILDGFDEVAVEHRSVVERQILTMDRKFQECPIVVSSRPNETFIGWKTFHKLDVLPFDRSKTLELVGKAPIDKSVISRFQKLLDDSFFEKYEEFLSSPLLALMMLLTLKQKGDLTDNIIDFYDNAFHALYSEHDAIKEMYKRPHCMSITDFKLVFSTFCMFSYYKEKFDFKESQIIELIDKSLEHVNLTKDPDQKLTCSAEDFLYEMCDAISLLRKDGMEYVFNHRSFQEFFTANWVMNIDNTKTAKLLEDFALRPGDNVLSLSYQINKPKVDTNYIIPYYERLISAGCIHRARSAKLGRWAYVIGYALKIDWTGFYVGERDGYPNETAHYVSWDNGEVGVYYSAVDKFIFDNKMRSKFNDAIAHSLEIIRPQPLLERIRKRKITKERLVVEASTNGLLFRFVDKNKETTDVSEFIQQDHPKFFRKVERAMDELNDMLHELNKMINNHILNTIAGHEKSSKSLDEMFF